ncbi:polysaccharide deacetylase family protein [Microbacterium sp. ASV81]|uniref:Polysaccharide deacetylase family protein n=1 Tax=Microbacterium capsulatum TaxID=3041921 RepID=A0ABU0XC71_9MICO|nr:polysaccharide deacetylase family protein [Microbacterium sp. ASV81]MDQ4212710.1 polysaccharide deacetylase family protein [Microbacterium sp. ASV81]
MNSARADGPLTRRTFGGLLLAAAAVGMSGCATRSPERASSTDAASPAGSTATATATPRITVASVPEAAAPVATGAAATSSPAQAVIERHASQNPRAWGMQLPGIRSSLDAPTSADGHPRVALTFDACGGPAGSGFDEKLVTALIAQRIPATLFLNGRWIDANPVVARKLFAEPLFEIGNHGTLHRPLSVRGRAAYGIPGTSSAAEAVDEVWVNHERIRSLTGRAPRWFRPGTAHYDDVAVSIVHDLGETPLGFTVNGDGGATFPARVVAREVGKAVGGDIVLAHMNQPGSGTADGVIAAIAALHDRGAQFVHID